MLVAALGDSITAGSPHWDPNPALRLEIGGGLDERSQWEYWAARANPRFEFFNHGVYGERTDQIAARLEAAAAGAAVLVIQGGINDIAQGRPVGEAAENLRGMILRGLELGMRALVCNVLPWNGGWPRTEQPIRELNELIVGLARDEGVPLLPFHETLVDPLRPGRMREEWTSDGDHPSIEGYRRLGELVYAIL